MPSDLIRTYAPKTRPFAWQSMHTRLARQPVRGLLYLGIALGACQVWLKLLAPVLGVQPARAESHWPFTSWRKGGLREVLRNYWPVTAALLLSFVWFGFWPLYFQDAITDGRTFNASLWPTSIPVGLGLLAAAFHNREIRIAMAPSPCLSPFVLFHAWAGALAAILTQPIETIATVAGLWILVIYRAFTGAI